MRAETKGRVPPVTDEKPAKPAQWSRDARRRGMKRFVHALHKRDDMRTRLGDSEDMMERAAEDYRRSLFLGAHLAPMPTVEVTVEALPLDRAD